MKGLDARLREIRGYLDLVIDEKLPLNHEILYHLQVHSATIIRMWISCFVNCVFVRLLLLFKFLTSLSGIKLSVLKMQDVFNLLPNLNVSELIKAFAGTISS